MNKPTVRPLLGYLVFAVMIIGPASAQTTPAPAAQPQACSGPEHRQFNFWVGKWDLTRTGQNVVVGQNLIEKLFNGCVFRETWTPRRGAGGSSLNHYDSVTKRWHQTWIDGTNTRVVFEGGMVGSNMVLTGYWKDYNGPGQDALIRMTYIPGADGSIHQTGEASTDHGVTWSSGFDFTYRKSAQQ